MVISVSATQSALWSLQIRVSVLNYPTFTAVTIVSYHSNIRESTLRNVTIYRSCNSTRVNAHDQPLLAMSIEE